MANASIHPQFKENTCEGDFDVPDGYHVILHELFMAYPNGILFIELDATIWFV